MKVRLNFQCRLCSYNFLVMSNKSDLSIKHEKYKLAGKCQCGHVVNPRPGLYSDDVVARSLQTAAKKHMATMTAASKHILARIREKNNHAVKNNLTADETSDNSNTLKPIKRSFNSYKLDIVDDVEIVFNSPIINENVYDDDGNVEDDELTQSNANHINIDMIEDAGVNNDPPIVLENNDQSSYANFDHYLQSNTIHQANQSMSNNISSSLLQFAAGETVEQDTLDDIQHEIMLFYHISPP